MVRQVSWRKVGALLLMLALSAVPRQAAAQITSGSVTGSIRDGQGGVIPGASVTLISAARGTSLEVTSNEHGDFAFPIVGAETYVLRVGLAGFKTLTRPGIIVHAGDRVSLGVLTIEVGGIAETVTVLAGSPQLQLKSAERSFAVEGQAVQKSPSTAAASSVSRCSRPASCPPPLPAPRQVPPPSARTGSEPTRTTSRSTASPTWTPATTAARWWT